ncbi:MAG: hypothetical protein IJ660_00235 [Alphaproteobacteria bacterium]|nr:hypothetical protein [Alphaproteobacteria bacterium]
MSTNISGVTNRDDNGRYSWEKSVVDVNDVDESFKTARDLGYTRLNYARVTTVSTLDKYDQKDMYAIQLQSNGNLRITMKSGDSSDEKVLDLSKYESALEDIKRELNPLDYATDELDKLKKDAAKDIFEQNAPGLYMKVYMTQHGKQVLIADSTADKDSKLYQAAEDIMNGDYRAKKGNYFIETGFKSDAEISKDGSAYALQIQQGTSYKHDYVTKEYKSEDSKNQKTTTTKDMELEASTNTYGTTTISAAYAAQIQAQSYATTATMLSNAYLNLADINTKTNKTAQMFSTLLNV